MSRNDAKLQPPHIPEGQEMIGAMRRGVFDALEGHKNAGRSVVIWDRATGQIVHLRPEEIQIPEIESGSAGPPT